MAWRFVLQPNGLLALFTEVSDDFEYYDMSPEEALELCAREHDTLTADQAEEKVGRALAAGIRRWMNATTIMTRIHGRAALDAFLEESELADAHAVMEIMEL